MKNATFDPLSLANVSLNEKVMLLIIGNFVVHYVTFACGL